MAKMKLDIKLDRILKPKVRLQIIIIVSIIETKKKKRKKKTYKEIMPVNSLGGGWQ